MKAPSTGKKIFIKIAGSDEMAVAPRHAFCLHQETFLTPPHFEATETNDTVAIKGLRIAELQQLKSATNKDCPKTETGRQKSRTLTNAFN
jgi:hypothetical protein